MTMYNAKQIYIIGRLNIKIKLLIFMYYIRYIVHWCYSAIRYLKRICIKMYSTITFSFYPFKSFIYHVLSHHQLITLNHVSTCRQIVDNSLRILNINRRHVFWHLSPKSTLECVIVVLIVISIYILHDISQIFFN